MFTLCLRGDFAKAGVSASEIPGSAARYELHRGARLVFGLVEFLPDEPMIRLGVLLVLLTPCVDYVVTFSHLGRADAKLLLAATPALLILQMLLLPAYLGLILGSDAERLIRKGD